MLRSIPQNCWGVLGGLLIGFYFPLGQIHASQEPIMRVLINESQQLRFRADGDRPLIVKGGTLKQKRISTLKIRRKDNQKIWQLFLWFR